MIVTDILNLMKRFVGVGFFIGITTLLTTFFIYPWFLGGYTINSGSFEPVYVAYAQFVKDHFPGFTFNPLWYLGFPNRFAFPPLFFYIIAGINKLFPSLSIPVIYHYTTGLFFILLPVAVVVFLRTLKLSWFVTILTTILFIFYPSILYIFPSLYKEVAQFSFPTVPILFLSYFGLGPRIMGLVFSLIALSFLFRYLKSLSKKDFLLTVIFSAAVFLTDQVTSAGYMILATSLVLSFALFKPIPNFKRLILVTYGLIAWFYNFSYIKNLYFAPSLAGMSFASLFSRLFKVFLLGVPLILALFSRKFVKKEKNIPLTFAILSSILFGSFILIYYLENPKFISEFIRFLPEFGIVFSILVATKLKKQIGFIVILLVIPMLLVTNWQKMAKTTNDPSNFREYKLASYLKNLNPERVYATGSMAFWLNSFGDVPQVRGGSDQAGIHKRWKEASFYIREGEDSLTTLYWLKALNVTHIVLNDATSGEFYKNDFKNLYRFNQEYKVLYDQEGDKILQVPLNSPQLAQIVEKKEINSLSEYVDWVDTKARPVQMTYLGNKLVLSGDFKEGQAVVIQIAYDKRWKGAPIHPDSFGNIYFEVKESVNTITLTYSETFDVIIGILITLLTIGSLFKVIYNKAK